MGYLRDYVLNTNNKIDGADLAMQIANGNSPFRIHIEKYPFLRQV